MPKVPQANSVGASLKSSRPTVTEVGIAIGAGLGTAVGILVGGGAALALCVAVGVAVGVAWEADQLRRR